MATDSDFGSDDEGDDEGSGEGSHEASGEKHGDDDHREADPSAAPAPVDPSAAPAPVVPVPGSFRGMYYKQGLGFVFRYESFLCAVRCHVM